MKRLIACLLVVASLLGLTACAAAPAPAETTQAPAVTEALQAVQTLPATAPTVPETTAAAVPDPFVYLTVSRITFSVVGESEDVYIGTAPREEVTWVSNDESVATFQDGVLTAVGVGETTAYAEYNGKKVECTVGCLSETEENLVKDNFFAVRKPKRFPPIPQETNSPFFDDAVIIGDSIGYCMFQWHTKYGGLGNMLFFCQGGCSVNGLLTRQKKPFYKGSHMPVEEALVAAGVKKMFIMLGENDLGFLSIEDTIDRWHQLLDLVWENVPDMEVYIMSCIPAWAQTNAKSSKNEKIAAFNVELKAFAEEKGCQFIDLYAYVEDHVGKMPVEYNLDDNIHMNEAGCMMWIQLLASFAEYKTLKGETK